MTDTLLTFAIFWGIWLLVPMLIDGSTAVAYLVGVWRAERRRGEVKPPAELSFYPQVSVIIPVHNGMLSIGPCLESIRRQSYPNDRIEVIVVNNLSTDETFAVFEEQQMDHFEGAICWISTEDKGKAWALNAGLHVANGSIICNIDCDVLLHRDAILNMVRTLEADPSIAAATGSIEVLPEERKTSDPLRHLLTECEFVEYYAGFRIGRQYQTTTNSLFTLAGAFSAFRREVLLRTFLYSNRTVSEDTDLTFDIHHSFQQLRVACVPEAIAYVEPTPSLGALYSQRVRWQRGQLEVAAAHPQLLSKNLLRLKGLSPPRALVVDHTLAFPRVIWTFLLPTLYFLGYPLPLVVSATLSMYICYMAVEATILGTCYLLAENGPKQRIRRSWWIFSVMPAYRFLIFWFRFGGFLSALMEPPQWRVETPWVQTKRAGIRTANGFVAFLTYLLR